MALPPYICIYIYIIYICTLVCTNIIFVEIHFKFRYEFFRSIKITDNLITHNMYVYYITSKWRALYKVSKGSTARLTAKKYTRSSLRHFIFVWLLYDIFCMIDTTNKLFISRANIALLRVFIVSLSSVISLTIFILTLTWCRNVNQ